MFENITNPYKYAAMGLAAVLVIGAAGGTGYVAGIKDGDKRVAAAQVQCEKRVGAIKLALANAESRALKASSQVSDRVVTQYVDRIRYVDRVRTEYVNQANTVVPTQFELSQGWVYVYNQSATGQPSDPALASKPETSGVTDTAALTTIVDNNSSAQACREQLTALQSWVRETKAAIDGANK